MMQGPENTYFLVRAFSELRENVYVVGNIKEFGEWNPKRALKLYRKDNSVDSAGRQVWHLKLDSRIVETFSYRYFLAETGGDNDEKLKITKWETNLIPRTSVVKSSDLSVDSYNEEDISMFGNYGGCNTISSGWLLNQTEVQIRLHSDCICMWKKKYKKQIFHVRCNVVNISEDDIENNPVDCTLPYISSSETLVSVLENGSDLFVKQDKYGTILQSNAYMIFKTQTFDPIKLGIQLLFYSYDGNTKSDYTPTLVGHSLLMPVHFDGSNDTKVLPIISSHYKPIGQVSLGYFIARPIENVHMSMEASYQNYWNHNKKMLQIGHRGMGESYSMEALMTENTICSFNMAQEYGADMVELDTHLSKDFIPIVFHDFVAAVLCKEKDSSEMRKVQIPIKDLTATEIRSLKLTETHNVAEKKSMPFSNSDDIVDFNKQPFPTLQEVLQNVDQSLGFNIEIKYPLMYQNGKHEQENFFPDRNKYIDSILNVVMRYAGKRKIFFSSFDPDSCILLNLKQNKYPVLFLTMGETKKYTLYEDPRTQTIPIGIHFAKSENLLGMVVHSEELVKKIGWIQEIKDAGLVCFTWGADNNSKEMIHLQKQNGADGVVFDRMDCYSLKEQKS